MSWDAAPPELRDLAAQVLTRRQIDVLRMHLDGAGITRISLHLGISRTTAREHRDRALQILISHPDFPDDLRPKETAA